MVRDGALVWSAARGDVAAPHTDVQHRLGSITKSLTAVAVMRLRDEGLLSLDDPLERLKDWMERNHATLMAAILVVIGLLVLYKGIHTL